MKVSLLSFSAIHFLWQDMPVFGAFRSEYSERVWSWNIRQHLASMWLFRNSIGLADRPIMHSLISNIRAKTTPTSAMLVIHHTHQCTRYQNTIQVFGTFGQFRLHLHFKTSAHLRRDVFRLRKFDQHLILWGKVYKPLLCSLLYSCNRTSILLVVP